MTETEQTHRTAGESEGKPGKHGLCLPEVMFAQGYCKCSKGPNLFPYCDTKHLRPIKEAQSPDVEGGMGRMVERVRGKDESQVRLIRLSGQEPLFGKEKADPQGLSNFMFAGVI